jgi:hypothetical protein
MNSDYVIFDPLSGNVPIATPTALVDTSKNTLTVAQVEAFHGDVVAEVYRAIQKFPNPYASMAALTEETGGLAQALLSKPWAEVRKEAIQVAAMALRIACEGDPSLDPVRAHLDGPGSPEADNPMFIG